MQKDSEELTRDHSLMFLKERNYQVKVQFDDHSEKMHADIHRADTTKL